MDSTAAMHKNMKKKVKLTAEEFIPKRFGLNFNPPMIILEYMLKSRGKLYLKKFKLFKLKSSTGTEVALKYLKMRYPDIFSLEKFTDNQMTGLIDRLKAHLKKSESRNPQTVERALNGVHKKSSPPADIDEVEMSQSQSYPSRPDPKGPLVLHPKKGNFIKKVEEEEEKEISEDSSEGRARGERGQIMGEDLEAEDFEDNFDADFDEIEEDG